MPDPSIETATTPPPFTVTCIDETGIGNETRTFTLELPRTYTEGDRISLRELIRSRVRDEVHAYNTRRSERFLGLVPPTETETALNGERDRRPRTLDWELEAEKALELFANNGFLVLVDERQLTDLETRIDLRTEPTVTFLKLVPLVGG